MCLASHFSDIQNSVANGLANILFYISVIQDVKQQESWEIVRQGTPLNLILYRADIIAE